MRKISLGAAILAFFFICWPVQAKTTTNKFGIHILEPNQLNKAKELVNSSGGDWGFVTIVIRQDDQNLDKWQSFFDDCRQFHIVPLIRIATKMENDFWLKPQADEADKWADFLGSLNWPTKEQWVIVYNEPNHASEWGGEINPEDYAKILEAFISKLKARSNNFKILNAGFDLAAPNSAKTMDALFYWQRMEKEIPGIFQKLDGWASHSYPNHGFIGTPYQKGRTSILGYQWELRILASQFGVKKDYPVFITETGWPYKINSADRYYTMSKIADFFKIAYQNVWLPDERIVAVTPFLLYYPQYPFANFSWITDDNKETEQFTTIKEMAKVSWWPEQKFEAKLEKISLPPFLPTKTEYKGRLTLRNLGQSIWGEKDAIELKPKITDSKIDVSSLIIPSEQKVKPNEAVEINFTLKCSTETGEMVFGWEEFPSFSVRVIPSSVISKAEYSIWQKVRYFLEKITAF